MPSDGGGLPRTYGNENQRPSVSWDAAKEFCRQLTAGLPDKLKGQFAFRLPTDAEWSVAVGLPQESGSTPKEKDGQIKDVYPWGTQWPPPSGAGNYADKACKQKYPSSPVIEGYADGYADTAPVGSFKPNQFGLYDLSGNVWEWCEDWYDSDQKYRGLRGGSWLLDVPRYLLSSSRDGYSPDVRREIYGFRVVLGVGGSVRKVLPPRRGAKDGRGAGWVRPARRVPRSHLNPSAHAPEKPGKRRGAGRGR